MSVQVASQQQLQWADNTAKDDPEQALNPALTPADTNALLQGAFPQMDLDQYLNPGCSSAFDESTFDSDDNFGCDGLQHEQLLPAKVEPLSPGSLPNAGWDCLQQPDWTTAYDEQMFNSGDGGFDMECTLGSSLDSESWCSTSSGFAMPQMPAEFTPPPMPVSSERFEAAPEAQFCVKPNMPAVRTAPCSSSGNSSGNSDATATVNGGKCMLVPTMSTAAASPTHSSDDSDVTPHSCLPAVRQQLENTKPAGGIARAAALMPAIGEGLTTRRAARLSAKPSDAELKEAIAELQRTTTRSPLATDEAHTSTRAECLERYREKKLRRLDVNTIRYMKRKINADRRPRIKGRFVKAEELDAYRAGLLPGQNGIPPTSM